MKLLFITQKLHGQDAFGVLWIRAFIAKGYQVEALCLESSGEDFGFPVHSMGKEKGRSSLQCALTFEKKIMSLKYDRVFVHMSPVWYALGWWYWLLKGIPAYLWYTHYKMQLGVRLFGWFGKRFFCATEQSLPQYPSTSSGQATAKKVVIGHGIDLNYWPKRANRCNDPYRLLVVHRLSRSKRLEIILHALTLLPERYTVDIYGIEAEQGYTAEMKALVEQLKLSPRVTFHGSIPMTQLAETYIRHRLILNMASETIDKTMLEAMTCGCYPVTTAANAEAIGIPKAPADDTPQAVAAFIQANTDQVPVSADELYRIVQEGHSLVGLIDQMDAFISKGH